MVGWLDDWMVEWLDGWMVGWLDGWMVGWLDGWMVGWLDGWISLRKHFWKFGFLNIITLILLQGFVKPGETVVLSKGIED